MNYQTALGIAASLGVLTLALEARASGMTATNTVRDSLRRPAWEKPLVPKAPKVLSVDLGGGITMDFVWSHALGGWVGKYEVTNAEYRRFKSDHNSGEYQGHTLNGDRQPVVQVSYDDAMAFAEWINTTAELPGGYKCRLPGAKEWMTLAQCGDGRKYPWGSEWPPKYGNYGDLAAKNAFTNWPYTIGGYNDGYAVSCPVEKSGKNQWEVYGVAGNVWEWTSELYGGANDRRVVRGASWDVISQDGLECACRGVFASSSRNVSIGFRLVLFR